MKEDKYTGLAKFLKKKHMVFNARIDLLLYRNIFFSFRAKPGKENLNYQAELP